MKRMVLFTMGLLVLAGVAAAVEPMIMQGTRAVSVSGSLDDDGEDIGVNLNGRYGQFISDGIEAGGYAGFGSRGDNKDLSVGAFGEYSFDMGSQVVPYAGGSAGFAWIDRGPTDDSYFELQAWGGARYFFIDYAALGCDLVMKFATEDVYNRGEDAIDWVIRLSTKWFF
ncbi:MAG: hypothetical protein HN919_20375 [Verrucomicrobia bacterium]|jgi:hypothetical protein|nr:hypothetical protein [Verrucomicrobiota bacterium]MBT7068662.1 hypothetical protein [Verrucomicrobiota bacterium]MBT7701786.1 hypothetical protein [Verrucomicrobiota bacterium]